MSVSGRVDPALARRPTGDTAIDTAVPVPTPPDRARDARRPPRRRGGGGPRSPRSRCSGPTHAGVGPRAASPTSTSTPSRARSGSCASRRGAPRPTAAERPISSPGSSHGGGDEQGRTASATRLVATRARARRRARPRRRGRARAAPRSRSRVSRSIPLADAGALARQAARTRVGTPRCSPRCCSPRSPPGGRRRVRPAAADDRVRRRRARTAWSCSTSPPASRPTTTSGSPPRSAASSSSRGRYGLVLFSDVAYQALPPGTRAAELAPVRAVLRREEQRDAGRACRELPRSPFTDTFSAGTRISTGLALALDVIRDERSSIPPSCSISDLDNETADLERVTNLALAYRRAGIPLHVVGLNPAPEDEAFMRRVVPSNGSFTTARLPEEGDGSSSAPVPWGLLCSASPPRCSSVACSSRPSGCAGGGRRELAPGGSSLSLWSRGRRARGAPRARRPVVAVGASTAATRATRATRRPLPGAPRRSSPATLPPRSSTSSDDLSARDALRRHAEAVATPRGLDNGQKQAEARARAEVALSDVTAEGTPAQASQAGNLLGVLVVDAVAPGGGGPGANDERARAAFDERDPRRPVERRGEAQPRAAPATAARRRAAAGPVERIRRPWRDAPRGGRGNARERLLMLGALVLLSPWGALVSLAAIVPVLAVALAAGRCGARAARALAARRAVSLAGGARGGPRRRSASRSSGSRPPSRRSRRRSGARSAASRRCCSSSTSRGRCSRRPPPARRRGSTAPRRSYGASAPRSGTCPRASPG